jgi:hypothetical protein
MRDEHLPDAVSSLLLSQSGYPVSLTGSVVLTPLVAITIPALGPNSAIRVTYLISATNNANNKTFHVTFGGTSFHFPTLASFATSRGQVTINNRGSNQSQVAMPAGTSTVFGQSTVAPVTGTVDTSRPQTLQLQAQLGNAGDVLTLESWSVELLGELA